MYKYEEPIPLLMKDILSHYSQEDIFKIVFGEYPDYNRNYLSPFRPDNNPNCFFEWYKGQLLFRDFADIRRDCFHSVKDYFKLNTYQATFEFIFEYFKDKKVDLRDDYKRAKKHQDDQFYDIFTATRPFEYRDYLYWKEYYITNEQLQEDAVYPIYRYRFYSRKKQRWFVITPMDVAYAISGFSRTKKIYRPKSGNKDNKWLTNCGANDIGNVNNLSTEHQYLMITKSYKDHRVIRNEGYSNTVWFQSEKMYPDDRILMELLDPYPDIFIFYDNDAAGIEGSEKLRHHIMELFPSRNPVLIYSPYTYFKDPASVVSTKGKKILSDLLWNSFHL